MGLAVWKNITSGAVAAATCSPHGVVRPCPKKRSLFEPVVHQERFDPRFVHLSSWEGGQPARRMLEEIWAEFDDRDGNFLQQFQTTAFDARLFELYLFAYFSRSGFDLDRAHEKPDFMIRRNDLTVAVEATTVNPPTAGTLFEHGKEIWGPLSGGA